MSNLKSGKICLFGKGLVHGFGQKCETFSFSLSRLNIPKKVIHNVSDKKLASLEDKNVRFKKWQNLLFCKGVSPWFWSKICNFFILLFFRSNTPEKVSHDVLGRKLAILDNKNIEFKKWQNFHFF